MLHAHQPAGVAAAALDVPSGCPQRAAVNAWPLFSMQTPAAALARRRPSIEQHTCSMARFGMSLGVQAGGCLKARWRRPPRIADGSEP